MQKSKAAAILAGINPTQRPAASAPTNLHVMSGEVVAASEDGQVAIKMPGMLFGDDDDQCIEVDTLGGLEEGDTATVLLAGESGKGMSPMAIGGVGNIDRIVSRVVQTEHLIAEKADISDLEANYAHITEGVIDNATIGYADVDGLSANYATIGNLNSATGRISALEANTADIETIRANSAKVANLTADQLSAATAYIASLTSDSITAASLSADIGKIHSLTAAELSAAAAYIASLTAGNVTAANLIADHGDFATVKANAAKVANLTAQQLEADHATIGTLDTTYMHADMSNSDVAWISNGVIANGAISSAMINDVSANKLTAGTINGSVINVTNLNADNITTGTINGQRIGEGSLSLSKLEDDVYTEAEVDAKLSTMQSQIDGAIETWTGTDVPTLSNTPASVWTTTAEKDRHVGDVYFVVNPQSQQNGYNYRFTKSGSTYSWQLIKDNDVTNALQRLETAEGKITSIESFDSTVSSFMSNTDDKLESVKSRATSLETRMTDAEGDISDKVDTSTFNSLSQTVDTNTASITSLSSTVSQKADGSTVTALTNRVSTVEQDVDGIETSIGELQTTVSEKADSSTVTTVSNRLNTVSDTVDGHTQSISSITSTQTTMQGKLDKTIVETTQLWYTKENTTAPNKPTSQVTSTSTSGGAWRTVVPAYSSSYPNYFYCYQWKYSDGTYGWSSVTRDIAMGESQSTSRTAASDASTAKTDATTAVTTANTASTNASDALTKANTADTNASTALTTANTAASDASTAKTDAASAVSTANSASANASTAVSTANTAKATADKNVKSSLQLWFTKANETAPNKPTSKVTSTAVSGNGWRTVVPTYSASYPYYFYCYQYELADGTYTWSDVVYDRATTENQSNSRSAVSGVSTLTTKTNTISDTVDGHTQTLTSVQNTLSTKADSSTVSTLTTKVNTVSDTVDGHTSQLSSITSTQTSMQSTLNKTVKSSIQLWYSKANTTAPSKPTSQVTSTSTSGNAWRIVVPAYNASYPNYYYCWQYEYVDGTYGWSAVVRDIAMGESQSTARTADSNASAAVTTANTANTNASTALTTANTANTNASDAKTAATTASTTASEAKTTAETAASDASTAKTNAASAVSTANSASTTATNAQNTANANIKSSVQLWFTKANSTAPSKPTSVVSTSNANTANAWNLVVPVWNKNYPYYFYCYQQQKGDGNYQWTDVVYDRATSEAQQLANTTSTNLSTLQTNYATFKQQTEQFESTVGTTYATKTELKGATDDITELESRVSTNETSISNNSSAIALKANSSDVYTKTAVDGKITQEVSDRNAAITAKANEITSTVSKISSAKYVTAKVTSWTLANLRTYASEGHQEYWNVNSTDGLRVGDVVYIKGTDATRNVPIYIKTTVKSINSATTFTGISHGMEDILPVDSAISSINQSAETVKIQASKVEIDGTAVFSAISSDVDDAITEKGYQTSSQVESAITSKGYATTTQAQGYAGTAKSEAISAAASDATTKANAAQTAATNAVNKAYKKLRSQGIQLVTNGNGFMGDNTNWPALTFDGSKSNGSPGSFTKGVGYATVLSAEMFPVDVSKEYLFEFDAISSDGTGRLYSFLDQYDVDGKSIHPENVLYFANTLTTLAKDLNTGDTTVTLTSASNWASTSYDYQRALIFWDYKNSYGYTYPTETYSRNYYNSLYTDDSKVNKSTGVITLKKAWAGPKKAKGTYVSQGCLGNSYVYAHSYVQVPTEWTHYSFVYSGLDLVKDGADGIGTFRQGTAFAKVGFLWNYNYPTVSQGQIWVTNVSVKEATAKSSSAVKRTQRIWYRTNASSAPSTPGTASSNWVTKADDGNDAWTKMHVAISSTHKYIYTCEQYEMANGTVGYTSVLLDNTITVIDGGNIITGSVTANKLNAADINASNSLTIGALSTATQDDILNSNVEVGGRNLLAYSGTGKNWSYSTFTDGVYTRSTTATGESTINGKTTSPLELGVTYTFSAWMKTNGQVSSVEMVLYDGNVKTVRSKNFGAITTEWKFYTWTVTMPTAWVSGSSETAAWNARFDNNGSKTSGTEAILYVKQPKLEKGNKATDWTPAPEDVDASVEAAAKTATNYISVDQTGIRIADSNPATATTYQHQTATNTAFVVNNESMGEFSGNGVRIGKSDEYHTIVADKRFGIEYDTDRLFDIDADGTTVNIYAGGSTKATGVKYTNAYVEGMLAWFRSGCTISNGGVLDPDGNATVYTAVLQSGSSTQYSILDGDGDEFESAAYGGVYYTTTAPVPSDRWNLDTYLTPMQEVPSAPTSIEMGGSVVRFSDGKTTLVTSGVAEGDSCTARGNQAHAEGQHTRASGRASHAEGYWTSATGSDSHAEGTRCSATGQASHAEGYYCTASGEESHASGLVSEARNACSFAHGTGVISSGVDQVVLGTLNAVDSTKAFIIGNGYGNEDEPEDSSARSNALTVDWNGYVNAANVHNLITVYPTAEVNGAATTKHIPIQQLHRVGKGFEVVNGYVVCLIDGTIVIDGMQSFSGFNSGNVIQLLSYRCNNPDDISKSFTNISDKNTISYHTIRVFDTSDTSRACLIIPRRLVSVTAGQFICFAGGNTSSSTGKSLASATRNYYTLEYV